MPFPPHFTDPSQHPSGNDLPNWQDLPKGGVMNEPGSSVAYKTGNWVPRKLCFNPETCINCNLCWPVCPDDCIIVDEKGNMIGVDLAHCKDCGLCVEACPTKPKSLYFVEEETKNI